MKTFRLDLNVSNLGEQTHAWFPAPRGKFSVAPTQIQTDKKYGNKIAYFYFRKNRLQIKAEFSLDIVASPNNVNDIKQFLAPNRFVQSDDNVIKKLSNILTKRLQTDEEKAKHCFDFIVDYLTYANPIRGLYSSLQALTDRGVDCGGFSTLLVALFRSIKIPSRCVFGWVIKSKYGYHAWVEFFDRQKNLWIPADPSVAHLGKRTKLDAGFGFINDKRVTLSIGEDIDLVGNKIHWATPLLQFPVVVSLNNSGLPIPISEKLTWSVRH